MSGNLFPESPLSIERRSVISFISLLVLSKTPILSCEAAGETQSLPFLQRISLTAKDLEEEVEFFTKGLGLRLRQVCIAFSSQSCIIC